MTFSSTETGYVLVLETGDELVRCLIQFARAQELDAAVLSAVGSVSEVELGSGGGRDREHRRSCITEPLETCSLSGTLTLIDGEPFPHVHGSFARSDLSVIGGHVYQAVCGRRLEVAVQITALRPDPPAEPMLLNTRTKH